MSGNFKKFLLLWGGELISSIGGGLTSFGLGVYIFNTTGSAAGMAMVTLFGFLPTLVLGIPAGVLADRYDRRLLMMIGDGCSALGVIYILIAMTRDAATLPVICTGVLISAIFSALLEPSYKATITDLLTEEEYSKAGGLVSLAGSARYLISPLIAGLLLTVVQPSPYHRHMYFSPDRGVCFCGKKYHTGQRTGCKRAFSFKYGPGMEDHNRKQRGPDPGHGVFPYHSLHGDVSDTGGAFYPVLI